MKEILHNPNLLFSLEVNPDAKNTIEYIVLDVKEQEQIIDLLLARVHSKIKEDPKELFKELFEKARNIKEFIISMLLFKNILE